MIMAIVIPPMMKIVLTRTLLTIRIFVIPMRDALRYPPVSKMDLQFLLVMMTMVKEMHIVMALPGLMMKPTLLPCTRETTCSIFPCMTTFTREDVRNVPGAPMCSCLEQAPVVSRSDCTEITCNTETLRFRYKNNKIRVRVVEDSVDIEFNACQGANGNNNDLYAYYQRLVDEGLVEDQTAEVEQHIVGNDQCPDAIEGFLTERLGELGININ